MPEGDTVHKIAGYLRERILGATIQGGGLAHFPEVNLAGRRIVDVRVHGKHLFLALDDATLLRSHLGMNGEWHRYPAGAPWRRPAHQASIVIDLGPQVYVCFRAEEVELLPEAGVRRREIENRLGPDLLSDAVDLHTVLRRARRFLDPEAPAVDLLLDQRVASGIGNVYKSEVLFIERIDPHTSLARLADGEILRLFGQARDLLRRNVGPGRRVTRFEDAAHPLWVYKRRGRPCLRCGRPIRYERLGRTPRSTYFCASCQTGPSTAGIPG